MARSCHRSPWGTSRLIIFSVHQRNDLINLFSPDRIILGGWAGLLLGHHLLPAIRASAREHALAHPFAETTITVGRLGPDAVARGAATLPIQAFLNGTAVPAARHPAAADEIPTGTGRVG